MSACIEANTNQPIGLATYTLNAPGFAWITRTSPHYRLHYLPGSGAESEIDTLIDQNEAYLAEHLKILNVKEYDKVIDLFYFDSRGQIESIVSKPFRALADAESMTILAVRNSEEVARDAHEIMHVVSYDLWGGWDKRSESAWLGEGLATYADEPCNGYDMTELAAYILKDTEESVPLDSLATSFRHYPEMIGYPLMASFIEFILEKYGLERLKNLWREGYDGFAMVFGQELATIEKEWHRYVATKYPDPKVPDWPSLRENGCK